MIIFIDEDNIRKKISENGIFDNLLIFLIEVNFDVLLKLN